MPSIILIGYTVSHPRTGLTGGKRKRTYFGISTHGQAEVEKAARELAASL